MSQTLIDPRMNMLNDGPDPKAAPQHNDSTAAQRGGIPLDQMDDQDDSVPLGDDPASDNAVETDTVYTA